MNKLVFWFVSGKKVELMDFFEKNGIELSHLPKNFYNVGMII